VENSENLFFMRRCFELAKKAKHNVSPNPFVGALLEKNGEILATGFHRGPGTDHAEVDAFKNYSGEMEGVSLYCNLEPCCHFNKRTPPCVEAILKSGLSKVVISNIDPNPEVAGRGIERLLQNGIDVETGILEKEGELLNEIFFHNQRNQKAFLTLKFAQSLDGRVCNQHGYSKYMTSTDSREYVHRLRASHDAILVGRETLEIDRPQLDVRMGIEVEQQPIKVVLGNPYKMDFMTPFFSKGKILVVSSLEVQDIPLEHENVDFLFIADLKKLPSRLYELGICSVFVEGGSGVLSSLIQKDLGDLYYIFGAPLFLGNGKSSFEYSDLSFDDSPRLKKRRLLDFENDFCFVGERP
jgi:diaminohydroxyphosphoribosylaminopyrimidine deaminase / 5-amino-6-(5-phosphoribosylamino)uracil reductase